MFDQPVEGLVGFSSGDGGFESSGCTHVAAALSPAPTPTRLAARSRRCRPSRRPRPPQLCC